MLCTLYPSLGLARAPVRASKALMGGLAMVSRRRRTGRRCDRGRRAGSSRLSTSVAAVHAQVALEPSPALPAPVQSERKRRF